MVRSSTFSTTVLAGIVALLTVACRNQPPVEPTTSPRSASREDALAAEAREQEMRLREAREAEGRDLEMRQREAREAEARDLAMREREARETEVRELETRKRATEQVEPADRRVSPDRVDPDAAPSAVALRQAWKMVSEFYITGMPILEGPLLYAADWGGSVFAVQTATGDLSWKKSIAQPNAEWPWHGFAGTGAIDASSLYEASTEGVAYAIDKKSGDVRWKAKFATNPNSGNCGKILVHDNLLYIGLSSVEEGLSLKPGFTPSFIGEVVALDTRDGHEVWRRPLTEAPHTGVAVWSGFAIDPTMGTLFFTTGNNYTGEATPLSDSIVAADAKTGAIRWSRQVTEKDVWTMAQPIGPDFDFPAAPQLFEATIDGRSRRLLGAGQKSGVFHALDRETGKPIWQAQVGAGQIAGGIMAEAVIEDGRIYAWGNDAFDAKDPAAHPMDIAAFDAATGRSLWVVKKAQPAGGTGAGAMMDGVYYVPSYDGRVRGFRASDGKLVWTSEEHASVGSSVAADAESLYFGTGVPKELAGKEGTVGLFAYRKADSVQPASLKKDR